MIQNNGKDSKQWHRFKTTAMIQNNGNDSKQRQWFKTVGLSDLKLMRNGGVPIFPSLI